MTSRSPNVLIISTLNQSTSIGGTASSKVVTYPVTFNLFRSSELIHQTSLVRLIISVHSVVKSIIGCQGDPGSLWLLWKAEIIYFDVYCSTTVLIKLVGRKWGNSLHMLLFTVFGETHS